MKTSWFLALVSAVIAGAIGAGTLLQDALGKGPLTRTDVVKAAVVGGLLFLNDVKSFLSKPPVQGS